MSKILAYGFPLDANFGGPSVVHGLCATLKRVCPGHELIVYQQRKVDPISCLILTAPFVFSRIGNRFTNSIVMGFC